MNREKKVGAANVRMSKLASFNSGSASLDVLAHRNEHSTVPFNNPRAMIGLIGIVGARNEPRNLHHLFGRSVAFVQRLT